MKIFPLTISGRVFLGVEWVWLGWGCFLIGYDLDWQPAVHFGPLMMRVLED